MFKTFPQFSKLTLADREEYESYVKDFPPVSDISFVSLMLWWDGVGDAAVSVLNDNLVISYWIPGDDRHSGLSLVGINKVDESMCAILDHLRDQGEEPRLVNVPEFVVNNMRYPELFDFKTDGSDDEYVIALARFASIEDLPIHTRINVRRFAREFHDDGLEIKDVDLDDNPSLRLLNDTAENWPPRGVNNMTKRGREVFPLTIANGRPLDMNCTGLFIGGELQAYCLYFYSNDGQYITLAHARVNYDIPRIFNYFVYALSAHLSSQGVKYANIYSDNGSKKMRVLKIALRPEKFFRKYVIEPAIF